MVASVCMNPSIDRTLYLDSFALGGTNRALKAVDHPGGKGINTAIACRRLGLKSALYGYLYEDHRKVIMDALEKESVQVRCDIRQGRSRLNMKILVKDRGDITEVNEMGAHVPADEADAIAARIIKDSPGFEMLLLTGSLPPGCPDDFYEKIAKNSAAPVILDTTGEALRLGIRSGNIHLIKPNLSELESLVGRKLFSLRDIKQGAMECAGMGVKYVVVSMGKKGAVMTDGKDCFHCPAIPVKVGSTVGAGDCMVAGITYSLTRMDDDLKTTLKRAVAAGTAGTVTEGTDLLYMDDFNFFFNEIKNTKITDMRD
ncbi:MAG: 1-phosphofructokinase family hexose kinase [Christensenellales bacterium]|jgi:1-phosphofructokinase